MNEKKVTSHEAPGRNPVLLALPAIILVAFAVLAILAVQGIRGNGPLKRFGDHEPRETSTYALTGLDALAPGTCVHWNQGLNPERTRTATAYPCDSTYHYLELTGPVEIDGSGYGRDGPTEAEWTGLFTSACGPPANALLGYQIDPYGRFSSVAVPPTPAQWRDGERTAQCAIAINSIPPATTDPDSYFGFTGPVEGADQTRLADVGTCFGPANEADVISPVLCQDPHRTEVVGVADVATENDQLPDAGGLKALTHDQCLAQAEKVYGSELPSDVKSGYMPIAPSSWEAGRRKTECLIGVVGADGNYAMHSGVVRSDD